MKNFQLFFVLIMTAFQLFAQSGKNIVPEEQMQRIFEEVKTPFKYGLVLVPHDDTKKIDSPTIFRKDNTWYMTYILFDGRGYETWLAKSKDLLKWETSGRILSFTNNSSWDCNQAAGYLGLTDPDWNGTYELHKYRKKYWLSYLGGGLKGYEAGQLSIGIAMTEKKPFRAHEWRRLEKPVLTATDKDVRWWENNTLYKSTVIMDKSNLTGYPFVMFYNAKGDSITPGKGAERIGMAVSNDMVNWQRYLRDPVLNHHIGITGDAYIKKINNIWVMFYFGAFWQPDQEGAFNLFACSYDLINWTDWQGDKLIFPSEKYDDLYAHKPCVVKWNGVVYHFYCAVNKSGQRGIAVALSKDLGKSNLSFNVADRQSTKRLAP